MHYNSDMNNDIIPKTNGYECLLVNEIFSHVDDVAYIQKCILLPMFLCISQETITTTRRSRTRVHFLHIFIRPTYQHHQQLYQLFQPAYSFHMFFKCKYSR